MPVIFQNHTFPASALASVNDIGAAITTVTQRHSHRGRQFKLASLVLNIPFGKRGSTGIRCTAKGHGARWDGKEWTLPAAKFTSGSQAVEWFRANGLISGFKTREYVPWVWDRAVWAWNPTDIALDISFEDRAIAKQHGAKWDPVESRWYLPAQRVTQNAIDELNAAEAISGEINGVGAVTPPPPRPTTPPSPATVAAQQPTTAPESNIYGQIRVAFELIEKKGLPVNTLDALSAAAVDYGIRAGAEAPFKDSAFQPHAFVRTAHWLVRKWQNDNLLTSERIGLAKASGLQPKVSAHHVGSICPKTGVSDPTSAFVCFVEVPVPSELTRRRAHASDSFGRAVAVITGIRRSADLEANIQEYNPLTLVQNNEVGLQGVILHEDATELYETLANSFGFRQVSVPMICVHEAVPCPPTRLADVDVSSITSAADVDA